MSPNREEYGYKGHRCDQEKGRGGGICQKLGLRLRKVEPGYALVEMALSDDMGNIFDMAHGGAIFSLIDEAFEISCNTHETVAVALSMTVTYHRPPSGGSVLRAESKEI